MTTKNEVTEKEKQPIKSIKQQLEEKAEKEREQAIARNKEMEEQRKLEEQQREEEKEREFRQKKEIEQARFQQVFKKYKKKFEPMEIGEADPRQKMKIEKLYAELCNLLNKVIPELADFLKLNELPQEKLFEFIKSDPGKWLPKQYIEANNVEIPGSFDIDKVIEMGMVPIPSTDVLSAIHANILRVWKNIQSEGFIFPLKKLFNEDENQFVITIDFYEGEDEYLTVKTKTPEQNVIITILENLLESLYDLSDIRLIKLEKGPAELNRIDSLLNYKAGDFTIKPNIFRHPALKQYYERPERNTKPATLDELLK